MATTTRKRHFEARCLLAILISVFALPFASAGDPYLDGLKAESSKLEQMGRARKEQEMLDRQTNAQASARAVQAPRTERTPAGFADFEKGLRAYPAGAGLYEKLDKKGKEAVFAEYLKADGSNRRYSAAIKKTIELSVQSTH